MVLPVTDKKEVLLLEVYRKAVKQISLELPRGFKELEEESAQAAKRELFEETNVNIDTLQSLGSIYPDSGIMNSDIELFLAQDITLDEIYLQKEENLENYQIVPYRQVIDMCISGEIKDSFTIAAIFRAIPYLK